MRSAGAWAGLVVLAVIIAVSGGTGTFGKVLGSILTPGDIEVV